MTSPSLPGSRLFMAGAALTVLFAAAHVAGVVGTVLHAGDVPGLREQFESLRAFRVPGAAGVETTLWGLRQFFNFAFSVLLMGQALVGVVVARFAAALGRADLLRACAAVMCAQMIAVTVLGVVFGVVQAIVTAGVIALLYGMSARSAGRRGPVGA